MSLKIAIQNELTKKHPQQNKETTFIKEFPYYLQCPENQLIKPSSFKSIEKEINSAGKELVWKKQTPPKFQAIFSSSALAVNTFLPVKENPKKFSIKKYKYLTNMEFEKKCPTGLRGTPPHLDVFIENEQVQIYIESKFLEIFSKSKNKFAPSYDKIVKEIKPNSWISTYLKIKNNRIAFEYLDAVQLIKHYFGIKKKNSIKKKVLLYVFWEPINFKEHDIFTKHRDEIIQFKKMIDEKDVKFETISYLDLWDELEHGYLAYYKKLKERYKLTI